MVITISGFSAKECWVGCEQGGKKAEMFKQRFESELVAKNKLFDAMEEIADYVNNELNEECFFEVM